MLIRYINNIIVYSFKFIASNWTFFIGIYLGILFMNSYLPHPNESISKDNSIAMRNKMKPPIIKFNYGLFPEYQPKMVPLKLRNNSKSKLGFSRYLYIKTELEMRSKLYIAILSDDDWFKKHATNLYSTMQKEDQKMIFFIPKKINSFFKNNG